MLNDYSIEHRDCSVFFMLLCMCVCVRAFVLLLCVGDDSIWIGCVLFVRLALCSIRCAWLFIAEYMKYVCIIFPDLLTKTRFSFGDFLNRILLAICSQHGSSRQFMFVVYISFGTCLLKIQQQDQQSHTQRGKITQNW